MPRSRKRHHSRSRSKTKSRSSSRDRSYDKHKKPGSHEKDGKRRRLDELIDSPLHKRSISSSDDEVTKGEELPEVESVHTDKKSENELNPGVISTQSKNHSDLDASVATESIETDKKEQVEENPASNKPQVEINDEETKAVDATISKEEKTDNELETIVLSDSDDTVHMEVVYDKKENVTTPKKPLTPRQLQKRMESEKKRMQKQKEREERERQREEEKAKIIAEKQKLKEQKEAERLKIIEEKQKQLELKQKEKEMKEEQKRKEKEGKEQKRKEKEEQEAQKRKEKEQERLKKLQEIEEKNKEKQREEEKKQKTAALFKNFFKKTDVEEKEPKVHKVNSYFKPFEVKSDMRLPPPRRQPLTSENKNVLDQSLEQQDENKSYLQDLKTAKIRPGQSSKTWPYEDREEVTIVDDDKALGENICEDTRIVRKMKAKFLYFHENRRPPYFGTWRKKSKFVKPRKPFAEDTAHFNYEEDSDDDWEEEEQGESLDVSGDEEEKDENDEDDYEVDNDFFVPHGHLSDDELDDEENAPLSPESLKQKLKLLKDEFDEDMKSQTRKLKPRSIGCIWFNKKGDNIDEAIYRYLQPFAMICNGPIVIKEYSESTSPAEKKKFKAAELPTEHVPFFLKIIHGNTNKKKTVVEEFLTYMANNDLNVDVSKAHLNRFLKQSAKYKRCEENGPLKNKFGWFVNDDVKEKYNICLDLGEAKNSFVKL